MQFKVPQNIDMEDRIIGPLTLSQFMYLLFGGVILYILFNKLILAGLGFLFWILAIPIGLFSFAMAFLRVNDRPFPAFVLAAIKFFSKPRQRVWQHELTEPLNQKLKTRTTDQKNLKQQRIEIKEFDALKAKELSKILDNPNPRQDE